MYEKEEAHSFLRLFGHLNYFAFCLSKENEISWMNKKCEKLLNKNMGQVSFTDVKKILKKEDDWIFAKHLKEAMDGKLSQRVFDLRHEKICQVEMSFSPIRFTSNETWALVLAKEIGLVQESHNFDYVEDAIIHSQKLAALGEASANLAHEINNPLFGIYTNVELLEEELKTHLNEKSQERFHKIKQLLDVVKNIVKGIRVFSRKEDESKPYSQPLSEIISIPIHLTDRHFLKEEIELKVCPLENLPEIEAYSSELEQVILNLLNNSLDAIRDLREKGPEKYNEAWVSLEVNETRDRVDLIITDCGTGIPENDQVHLCESFFTTKSKDKGTGLGLSIGQKIMERHEGSLYLDKDHPNTRFVMSLPKKQKKRS